MLPFFGKVNYLSATPQANALLAGPETIAAWVKLNSLPTNNWQGIVEQGNIDCRYCKLGLELTDSPQPGGGIYHLAIDTSGGGADLYSDQWTGITTGVWYHVAITFDGTYFRWYVNGSQLGDAIPAGGPQTTGTSQLFVGALMTPSPGGFLDGSVDEVGIWSRALKASEIAQLYNNGNGNQYPF